MSLIKLAIQGGAHSNLPNALNAQSGPNTNIPLAKGLMKKPPLIKLSADNHESGILGFAKRHPIIAGGVALTGGLAAADAVTEAVKHGIKSPGVGQAAFKGLKQGALYGGVLSTVEPLILHKGFKVPVNKEENT